MGEIIKVGTQLQKIIDAAVLIETTARTQEDLVLRGLIDQINALLASDDVSLDELQELVDYIKANRGDIDSLGIAGVAGLQAALDGKLDVDGNGNVIVTNDLHVDNHLTHDDAPDFNDGESSVNLNMLNTPGSLDAVYGNEKIARRLLTQTITANSVETIDWNLITLGIEPRSSAGISFMSVKAFSYPNGSINTQYKEWTCQMGFTATGQAYYKGAQEVSREFTNGTPTLTFDDVITQNGTSHLASNTTGVCQLTANNASNIAVKVTLDIEIFHL